MTRWAILTGEYPPQSGGVSDYTRLVAEGLAAVGDEVAVYAPPQGHRPGLGPSRGPGPPAAGPVRPPWPPLARPGAGPRSTGPNPDPVRTPCVRTEGDEPPIRRVGRCPGPAGGPSLGDVPRGGVPIRPPAAPAQPAGHRQPGHGLGHSRCGRPGAGLDPWLGSSCWSRSARGPGRPSGCRSPAMWPPRPSPRWSLPPAPSYAPDPAAPLVGHFGTFGRPITDLLEPAIVGLLRTDPLARVLLIGRGSERYHVHIGASHPDLAGRVAGTGELPPAEVAAHLRACDLLLQPYPDGVSSRRTSVMAGLANRVPIVTNLGALSEPLWAASTGVAVVPGPDPAALAAAVVKVLALPSESRLALGARGAELYLSEFALERTIERLRRPGPTPDGPTSSLTR